MNDEDYEEAEPPPAPEGLRLVKALRDIYLIAGMTAEAALRSALADYTCHFLTAEAPCAA